MDAERLEQVRADRAKGLGHVLLGVLGFVFAAIVWEWWFLPLRGPVVLVAAGAGLYELVVGLQYYQKASRLEELGPEAARARSPDAMGPMPCRRCNRVLLPGQAACAVCGEPATV